MSNQPNTFWIILAAGLILRLFFVVNLPLFPDENPLPGYNDEPMHLNYVRYVAEKMRWPVWTDAESHANPLIDEFPQPPLYYAIAAPAFKLGEWFTEGGGLYGARLISLLFGVATSLVAYWICGKVLEDTRGGLAGMAFVTFSPNLVIFSSLVSNDSMLFCLSAMAFASILLMRENSGSTTKQTQSGLLLGVAVWAKMSALALLPLTWFAIRRERPQNSTFLARWGSLTIAIITIIPLIIWNLTHYGEIVPTVSVYTPEECGFVGGGGIFHPITAVAYLARTAVQPFEQVWGSVPEKLITIFWCIMGMIVFVVGVTKLRNSQSKWLVLWGVALPVLALVAYNFRFFQIEARLLAPAVASISIIVAAGLNRLKIPIGWQCVIWGAPLVNLIFHSPL